MNNSIRILPQTNREDSDHSFVKFPENQTSLFGGWGPRL